ncbi:MAG: hypothetical protein ACOCQQ_01710 [Candidatus Nanoarchaeia archaeon]
MKTKNNKTKLDIIPNPHKQQIIIKGEPQELEELIHLFLDPTNNQLQNKEYLDNSDINMGLPAHERLGRYDGNLVYEPRMSSIYARKLHYQVLLQNAQRIIKKYNQLKCT